MLALELVSRRRKPVKRNAFYGIITGILLLILIGLSGHMVSNTIKTVLMLIIAFIFVMCLYIVNYSVNKIPIGLISFFKDYIEIEMYEKKEIIQSDKIDNIRFKLTGYEGLNKSSIFGMAIWSPGYFSYHSGMKNFVYIHTSDTVRKFEFYLANKRDLLNIKKTALQFHYILS
jgi:hypothetical protein